MKTMATKNIRKDYQLSRLTIVTLSAALFSILPLITNIGKANAALFTDFLVLGGGSTKTYNADTQMFTMTAPGGGPLFRYPCDFLFCDSPLFEIDVFLSSAVLEATIDNTGTVISGTFSIVGSIPDLGISDETLLAGIVNPGLPSSNPSFFEVVYPLTVLAGAYRGFEDDVRWETNFSDLIALGGDKTLADYFSESFEESTPLVDDIVGLTTVSEPTTAVLFGFGLVMLGLMASRRLRA